MQKLVSGIRLFTVSPRFLGLESLQGGPAQEVLWFFSDATGAARFAFLARRCRASDNPQ
jgi:hypothetical protein